MSCRPLVMLLLLMLAPVAVAQQDSLSPRGTVLIRRFDPERITAYRNDPAYDYERVVLSKPSLWERFKEWLQEWIGGLLDEVFGTEIGRFIGDNIFYLIAAIAVVMALVVLARGQFQGIFQGRSRSLGEVEVLSEDIRGMDFSTLIRQAEEQGDLRRAIRLHYLWVLRRLVDHGLLHWSPEHTDREYLSQLKDPELRTRFAQVVLVFQWVWYGQAEVPAADYDELRAAFVRFETSPVA